MHICCDLLKSQTKLSSTDENAEVEIAGSVLEFTKYLGNFTKFFISI